MNPVTWFEIPVADMDRARIFYQTVFQYEEMNVSDMGGGQMAWFPGGPDQNGSSGTLFKGEGYSPSHQGTVVYITVEDIPGTLDRIEKNGGKTLVPKMSIGEFGFIAHFEDCEGNRVALHSMNG